MVGDVKFRFVRSDGQEMTFGDGQWRIPSDGLENWANLPIQVSSVEMPSYDGAFVTNKRVNSIDRSIRAVLSAPSENETVRPQVISFFNPKYSFDVYATYMGRERWCHGELAGFKASEGNIYVGIQIDVTILCPNPYLQSVEDFGKDIAKVTPMFGFPFMSLKEPQGVYEAGFIVGKREFAKTIQMYNDGDVASGVKITMTFDDRTQNPWVRINGNKVTFENAVYHEQSILFDTTSLPPTVTSFGDGWSQNDMHELSKDSNLLGLKLEPGDNEIEYGAEEGEQNMHVNVVFTKQYLGI